jgi:hypothetical protein
MAAKKKTKKKARKTAKRPAPRAKKKALASSKKGKKSVRAASKKKAPKKRNVARAATKRAAKPNSVARRDGTGHLDPKYASELRSLSEESAEKDDNVAFFRKPRTGDDLAEQLGEEAVETATSGEDQGEDALNQDVPEERGGPFVETTASTEFAEGVDASNPKGARREPFPTT